MLDVIILKILVFDLCPAFEWNKKFSLRLYNMFYAKASLFNVKVGLRPCVHCI